MEEIHRHRPYFQALVDFYFSQLYDLWGWEKNQPPDNLRETLQTFDFWAQEIEDVIDLCKRLNQAGNTSTIPSFDQLQELHQWVQRIITLFYTGRGEEDEC
jgi:site-specific recombinase